MKRLGLKYPLLPSDRVQMTGSTITFPKIMGGASACETCIDGPDVAAKEGLLPWVSWPGTFTQEVMGRKQPALCNPVVLRNPKHPCAVT